ncbi:MAG: hypothetical protein LBD18_03280 [Treponema sp.]|nr:hypothetical protein [Treponema sp.]
MMKRNIVLMIVAGALTSVLPAAELSLSAGGGALVGGLFTRYTLSADGNISNNAVTVHADQQMNQINYGGFLFIDATWAQFSVGLQGGNNTFRETMTADSSRQREMDEDISGTSREMMLSFALLGKYPISLNETLTLFPLAGIEYQIALAEYRNKNDGRGEYKRTSIREADANGIPYTLPVWNSFFVDIGGGIDAALPSSLYLRTELLYCFRLQTFYELDTLEKVKKGVHAPDPKLAGLTSGPALKISAGWRFF